MKRRRIAFLTPEFVTEYTCGGGLANYLNRITQELVQLGHEIHVFVSSQGPASAKRHRGVFVHSVPMPKQGIGIWALELADTVFHRRGDWSNAGPYLGMARAFRDAVDAESKRGAFAAIQSSDYLFPGLFVPRRAGRLHIVRCSSASDLYADIDQTEGPEQLWRLRLEIASLRRADLVYAPSRFVAEHYRKTFNINVAVVRPPMFQESEPDDAGQIELPARFFLYFGQFLRRKGVDLLAQALPLVWARAPQFTMVWAGTDREDKIARFRGIWGGNSDKVTFVGALEKSLLYKVLHRADAAVLPSLVDNLPNTVMEALMLGIPVIGSRGASIDELVEQDTNGTLTPIGDLNALAQAIIAGWEGTAPWKKGFQWNSAIRQEMQPQCAANNLLRIMGIT